MMKVSANAKINLSLDVCSKRPDGYHDVCMIMQEINLHDEIEIEEAPGNGINLWCDKLEGDDSNIAYKAAALFYEEAGIRKHCSIKLFKSIPVCAGLGGGSSDAAAVLKTLNTMNGSLLTDEELEKLGLKLGADVPFFIRGKTALAEGIGEKLTTLSSPEKKWVVLIKPDIDVSTALAYREIDDGNTIHPDTYSACRCLENGENKKMYEYCGNSFEPPAMRKHPEIGYIKKHFYSCGAVFSMMSGSGPTVFGLFNTYHEAQNALETYNGMFQSGVVTEFV